MDKRFYYCCSVFGCLNTTHNCYYREGRFSVTAEYNSGVMSCFCGCMSSAELECTAFGVQCIGRSNTGCGTGCFGFPICTYPQTPIDNDGGASLPICPTAATSTASSNCKPPVNFDVERGVIDNKPQCEADKGFRARKSILARICDYCVSGLFTYPRCMSCTSSSDGWTDDEYDSDSSTDKDCDQATAQRHYKTYVTEQIRGMSNWSVVDINIDINPMLNITPWMMPPPVNDDSIITVHLAGDDTDKKVVYFGAPDYYLGDRLTSYGGYLTYSIWNLAAKHSRPIAAPNVIIGGNYGYIVHNSNGQPPAQFFVNLVEEEFTDLDGNPVSRDQFLNTLENVKNIFIRATYEDKPLETSLIAVTLDSGIETYDETEEAYLRRAYDGREDSYISRAYDESEEAYNRRAYDEGQQVSNRHAYDEGEDAYLYRASSVEPCQSFKTYRRMSCELCAESFFGSSSYCVPCQCNGHSSNCYVNVGVCMECTDGRMGDHCELCFPEHGDATVPYVTNNYDLSDDDSLTSYECNCDFDTAGCKGKRNETSEQCGQCASSNWGLCCSGKRCTPCDCASDSE